MTQIKTFLKIISITAGLVLASSVHALKFEPSDGFTIDFDTTLTYGAMWRLDDPSDHNHMMAPNGNPGYWGNIPGCVNPPDPSCGPTTTDYPWYRQIQPASTTKQFQDAVLAWNSDDGDRNFKKGDMVSNRFAMLNDIDFKYKDYGLFLRAQVFYDAVYFGETSWNMKGWDQWGVTNPDGTPYYLPDGVTASNFTINPTCQNSSGPYAGCASPFKIESDNNAYAAHEISDPSHFSDKTKNINGSKARFLDAFVYGTFHFGDRTLDLRIGRQTISWGEALMLQGGIGFAQNRIDANAATSPGVELKEIFLPSGAVYGQFNLDDTLTLEAYWQYDWAPSELFGTGSYFEGQDFLNSDIFLVNTNFVNGCSYNFGTRQGPPTTTPGTGTGAPCDMTQPYVYGSTGLGLEHTLQATYNAMSRAPDVEPDHPSDQFGFALRKLLDNGSEMGVFFLQYHDKYPSLWAMNNGAKDTMVPSVLNPGVNTSEVEGFNSSKYTISYKERIKLYGLSFNTVFDDIQMGFEIAYRPNQPVVPACTDAMLEAGTTDNSFFADPVNPTPLERFYRGLSFKSACKDPSVKYVAVDGYNSNQNSSVGPIGEQPDSGINWPPGKAADKLLAWPTDAEVFTANWGVTLVVPPSPFWDTGIFVAELGGFYVGSGFQNEDLKQTSIGSFTKTGYGVSAIFLPQYKNIMEGVDLTIPVFVNYGIEGSFAYYNYSQGALWASIGLEAVYLSNTRVGITYSAFGGDHMWNDRDNIAVTAKYTF